MNMQDLVGQTLDGKYNIIRELGRGGMGAVYFAVHIGTKRPVAVKVIIPQFMRRSEFVERFKREAEASGRLHHPNVVNVTDFGFAETGDGRVAYLVMEYLEGCTLGEILDEEKKLSLSWTVDILEQVCSAVHTAHRQGIIHRDLKPDNIWLEPNQRGGYTVKVLDFGIAKLETQSEEFNSGNVEADYVANEATQAFPAISEKEKTKIFEEENRKPKKTGYETLIDAEETSVSKTFSTDLTIPAETPLLKIETIGDSKATAIIPKPIETDKKGFYEKTTANITRVGAILGTPLYMSPEQCRGERLGTSSDIYSLGVIAYQMLSGKPPFDGEALSVLNGHLQVPPPQLPGRKIPRKIERAIHQALAKEPMMRPPTAEVFAGQLRSYSESVIRIFRRALVIFIENFSRLIWFSLLLYFPTILLAAMTFITGVLSFNGIIPSNISNIVQTGLTLLNISITVSAEILVAGAVTWIVVQYIDTPLRSFRITGALQTLFEKWKEFAWILPLRILINCFIQGELIGLPIPLIFLFTFVDSLLFWLLPCVVIMENFRGLAALKRSWKLSLKAAPTVIAAIVLNHLIFLIVGVSIAVMVYNLSAFVTQKFFPAVFELPLDEFNNFVKGIGLIAIKLMGTVLLPFFGVVTALVYLKTRHAGGESMKVLLDKFKESDILQSNWQKRVRQRSEQSKRSFSNP